MQGNGGIRIHNEKSSMYIHLKYLFKDEEVSHSIILVSFGHFLLSAAVIDSSEKKNCSACINFIVHSHK